VAELTRGLPIDDRGAACRGVDDDVNTPNASIVSLDSRSTSGSSARTASAVPFAARISSIAAWASASAWSCA
jgi:hypothetical protein